jgi:hypothetical protein
MRKKPLRLEARLVMMTQNAAKVNPHGPWGARRPYAVDRLTYNGIAAHPSLPCLFVAAAKRALSMQQDINLRSIPSWVRTLMVTLVVFHFGMINACLASDKGGIQSLCFIIWVAYAIEAIALLGLRGIRKSWWGLLVISACCVECVLLPFTLVLSSWSGLSALGTLCLSAYGWVCVGTWGIVSATSSALAQRGDRM